MSTVIIILFLLVIAVLLARWARDEGLVEAGEDPSDALVRILAAPVEVSEVDVRAYLAGNP